MDRKITIEPLTRIEGHAKITIALDEKGDVRDARLHITQFRGFEKLCEGRPFHEMPSLMARICGICPPAHMVASAKACDQIMAVRIPTTAANLRRLMNLAQIMQSHALSFFHLSAPDILLGMDADPATRNIFGIMKINPTLARDGIRLRQIGQEIIERLGGEKIHPAWIVPGGVSAPLTAEVRNKILSALPEALQIAKRTLDVFKPTLTKFPDEIENLANFPSLFVGLVNEKGQLEHYDGWLRIVDANRRIVADKLDPTRYQDYIGEAVEPWSYLKFPYWKSEGYPEGMYRVGPLARLNLADSCGTSQADDELKEFRALSKGAVLSSFHYHYARLIEIIFCAERMGEILRDPNILDERVRAFATPNEPEGVGVAEAPRGTLIHHYKVNSQGLITFANLVIATGHNNLAMHRGILQAAKRYVKSARLTEGMLNRVEAVIRAYDPCLSCSTHAVGSMPLRVRLVAADGSTLDEMRRE